MPIRESYEIQCDGCFALIGDRHDSQPDARQQRFHLLNLDHDTGRWLCDECCGITTNRAGGAR